MPKGLGKGINALFSNVDLSEETVEEIKLKTCGLTLISQEKRLMTNR